MSMAAAFLMIAQSASPAVADAPASRQAPVATSATASARILRPAVISFEINEDAETLEDARNQAVQRGRDQAGTLWIEFS